MLLDRMFARRIAAPALVGLLSVLGATRASATNETYSLIARTCSPYTIDGCTQQFSERVLVDGLNVGGGFAFASGYKGGYALASAVFNPDAPQLLQSGRYSNSSLASLTYSFQVQGAANTLVPLHIFATVSASAIHLTDKNGNVAALVDGPTENRAPNDSFKIVTSADLQISLARQTPIPGGDGRASIEAKYTPTSGGYCTNCGGGSDTIDSTIWVYSNTDIYVAASATTLMEYFADGTTITGPLFATASAETDPVFAIDDPAYAAFTIVGVPTGTLPSSAGAVPEPASWALMIVGFGVTGIAMRKRRRLDVAYAGKAGGLLG